MSREANIPLVLWICTAVVAHLAGGGGGLSVAESVIDRRDLRAALRAERVGLRPADKTFEVLMEDTPHSPGQNVAPPENDAESKDDSADDEQDDKDLPKLEQPKAPPAPPKVAEKAPPPEPPPPEKKVEIAVPVVPVPPTPPAPPLPPKDNRIAIRQHADKNQPDNPNANRIADDANTVKEETVARIRSKDQDAPQPTAGSQQKPGPTDKVGNADQTKIADSEEHKGNEKNAPGENNQKSTTATHSNPAPPRPGAPFTPSKGGSGGPGKLAAGGGPAAPPPSKGGAGPASPEVVTGNGPGAWTVDPANPGGDGKSRVAGKKRKQVPFQNPVKVGSVGLGGGGTPGGPNINLPSEAIPEVVGTDKLKQERAADGAARRSAHMGSNRRPGWEQMRPQIENYEPSVKLGNQTSLNAARSVFATYLNTIHNRIHPIFAERELAAMQAAKRSDPMNKTDLVAHVEIVLTKDQGRIVIAGIKKSSGVTAFDAVALQSVYSAGPFGKAPDAIVSPDGKVYLHWEFHRDPHDACTTRNARPYLLKAQPKPEASPTGAPSKKAAPGPASDDRPQDPAGPLRPLRQ